MSSPRMIWHSLPTEAVPRVLSTVTRTMHSNGDAEVRTMAYGACGKYFQNRILPSTSREVRSDVSKTNWESATVTTLMTRSFLISPISVRDPRSKVVTGGIVLPGFQVAHELDNQPSGTVRGTGQESGMCMGIRSVYRRTRRLY